MINQFMIEYFEESATTYSYRESLDNLRASLIINTLMECHNDYYFEASQNFKEMIKDFFAKLIQAIKDLVRKIKDYIHEKLQNIQMNKKLNDLKKTMVENKPRLNSTKVTILDTTKYMIAYRKYINLVTTEFRKLTSKKYENSDAFQKEAQRVNELIDSTAEKLGLTSSEKYAIETDIFNALSITEKSIKLYDNEFNVSAKEWEESIRTNGKTAEMEENPTIADRIKVLSHKFSNTCSKCFQFMSKHPIVAIGIIATAVASIIGVASAAGLADANDKYINSDIARDNRNKQHERNKTLQNLRIIGEELYNSNKDLNDAIDHNNNRSSGLMKHENEMKKALDKAMDNRILDRDVVRNAERFANEIWSLDRKKRLMNSIDWNAPTYRTKGKNDRRLDRLVHNPEWGRFGSWIE